MAGRTRSPGEPPAEEKPSPEDIEAEIDESIAESFPASDPPAWVNEARLGSPRRDEPMKDGTPDTDADPSGRAEG